MTLPPIDAPGGFVPAVAVTFESPDGNARAVSSDAPLPTVTIRASATSEPLQGTASSSETVGPFLQVAGREVVLSLDGTWTGRIALMRSTDGGASLLPATLGGEPLGWQQNINEIVWLDPEEAASLYLEIELESGSVAYRVAQ